jgi:hypothetical protein
MRPCLKVLYSWEPCYSPDNPACYHCSHYTDVGDKAEREYGCVGNTYRREEVWFWIHAGASLNRSYWREGLEGAGEGPGLPGD